MLVHTTGQDLPKVPTMPIITLPPIKITPNIQLHINKMIVVTTIAILTPKNIPVLSPVPVRVLAITEANQPTTTATEVSLLIVVTLLTQVAVANLLILLTLPCIISQTEIDSSDQQLY